MKTFIISVFICLIHVLARHCTMHRCHSFACSNTEMITYLKISCDAECAVKLHAQSFNTEFTSAVSFSRHTYEWYTKAGYFCLNEWKGLQSLFCTHMVILHSSGLFKPLLSILESSASDKRFVTRSCLTSHRVRLNWK